MKAEADAGGKLDELADFDSILRQERNLIDQRR